jgi:hypothetical protein
MSDLPQLSLHHHISVLDDLLKGADLILLLIRLALELLDKPQVLAVLEARLELSL